MPRYMVERNLPGFDASQLPGAAASAKAATAQMSSEGTPIRYLRSTFVPAEQKCYCLFEGPSEDSIREAQTRAELPYERIHEAEFITSEELA